MRKKSNHTATDSAARIPASRYPLAATATTTRIMASAASVFGMLDRNGTRIAASATGAEQRGQHRQPVPAQPGECG